MKSSDFKKAAKFFMFDTLITGIIVNKSLHGLGIETAIHERLDEIKQKHFRIDMSHQDQLFFQEFVAMVEKNKDDTVYVLDFTTGCDKELKDHLFQLIFNRQHNGFKIHHNTRTILIFRHDESKEYILPKSDDYWVIHSPFYHITEA